MGLYGSADGLSYMDWGVFAVMILCSVSPMSTCSALQTRGAVAIVKDKTCNGSFDSYTNAVLSGAA